MHRRFRYVVFALIALGTLSTRAVALQGAEWSVPIAGNSFRTKPVPGGGGWQRNKSVAWSNADEVYSLYVHLDRPAAIKLAIRARVRHGRSEIAVRACNHDFSMVVDDPELAVYSIGQVNVRSPGYTRVDLQGVRRDGSVFAELQDLVVSSDTKGLTLSFVRNDDGNLFHWGRRGPSVHLRYATPQAAKLQYAYTEVTVPPEQDPIGSFFMANGFGEGYFGIQVNGRQERRVLFSVWSPFQTNNPDEIPEDQRIQLLAKGPDVQVGEFGNEGSGGQSFLVYPWESGTTYRFLTEVQPDGHGNTVYTSWFGEKENDRWQLIASFRRPKTETHLRGFHSFLENFAPTHGHLSRQADYGNVFVGDLEGRWHECTQARFSVDATGRGRHRLDFQGGSRGDHFFLRNGGFFDETGQPGEIYRRAPSAAGAPEIDFKSLPRN